MALPRIGFVACFTLAAFSVTGCSTIYSETFSNKRNRFVPPPPQRSVLPADMQPLKESPAGGGGNLGGSSPVLGAPGLGGGDVGGGVPGELGVGAGAPGAAGAPMIPGL